MTTYPMSTSDIYTHVYNREYAEAKKAYPKSGEECWHWYASEAAQAAVNGYSSVAG